MSRRVLIAAVEGGGTSFCVAVCAIDSEAQEPKILHRAEIDSSHDDPQKTLQQCADFFQQHKPPEGYHALGIATFGPVGVHPDDVINYGRILAATPKAAWRHVNLLEPLQQACQGTRGHLAVAIDTDVNAPALAEYQHYSSINDNASISSVAYITVGTGVGVGLVVNDKPVHGRMHPEGGHVPAQPLPNDTFPGYSWGKERSPFRGVHTVEGLACSVALTERLEMMMKTRTEKKQQKGQSSSTKLSRSVLADLPDDHEIWDHAANALANLCVTLLLTLSIEKIVLGGGIMKRRGLMDQIRARTVQLLNGYLDLPADMSELITYPTFGADEGLVGAIVLAQEALNTEEKDEAKKKMKQQAFGVGLWHGFLVGAISVGLIYKYVVRRRK